MIAFRIALGLGLGLVVGATLAVSLRSEPEAQASAPAPSPPDLAACPELVAAAREAEALRERTRVAEELLRGLRATEIDLIGEAPPWPQDLPAELRPDQVRATVERAFEGTRYRIDGIDCEEFPCILAASWDVDPEDTDEHTKPSRKQSVQELTEKGVGNQQLIVSYYSDDLGNVSMEEWTAMLPRELKERISYDRLHHRRRMLEALWAEMAEADEEASAGE